MIIFTSGHTDSNARSGVFRLIIFLLTVLCFFIVPGNTGAQNDPGRQTNPFAAVNKPLVIEIVGPRKVALSSKGIKDIFDKAGQHSVDIYQWKNHVAGFGKMKDTLSLRRQLVKKYHGCRINIYHDMFYLFNRTNCGGGLSVKEWDNVLLTANMASDPKLQKEYLNYHAKQFQQWPEVSNGFCRADFQQLVIFKNGRQLMLIISIPKGADLNQLNPKTTENNPRVGEWNELMKKYQHGIEGTDPGEVWVFFKPVK